MIIGCTNGGGVTCGWSGHGVFVVILGELATDSKIGVSHQSQLYFDGTHSGEYLTHQVDIFLNR